MSVVRFDWTHFKDLLLKSFISRWKIKTSYCFITYFFMVSLIHNHRKKFIYVISSHKHSEINMISIPVIQFSLILVYKFQKIARFFWNGNSTWQISLAFNLTKELFKETAFVSFTQGYFLFNILTLKVFLMLFVVM